MLIKIKVVIITIRKLVFFFSVLEVYVVGEAVGHLVGVDLLVNCPRERLAHMVAQVCHPLHCSVFGVVCVHNTDEVSFSEGLEVKD